MKKNIYLSLSKQFAVVYLFLVLLFCFQSHLKLQCYSRIKSYSSRELENERILNLAIDCLKNSQSPYQFQNIFLHSSEARRIHYFEILNKTKHLLYPKPHCYVDYCGPWIENYWRDAFIDKPYESFGPFIPIFAQWTDHMHLFGYNLRKLYRHHCFFFSLMKPEFLYITVQQNDRGLETSPNKWKKMPPNLLILSTTPRGHIPIPYLKKELQPVEILQPKRKFIFMGSETHIIRKKILEFFLANFSDFFEYVTDKNWTHEYQQSEIILSPRGFSRACFRTYEILQLGMIPYIISNLHDWLPYENTKINWSEIAFFSSLNELFEQTRKILKISPVQLLHMRQKILAFRNSHFTFQAVINHISLFMTSGFNKSDLRCSQYEIQI
jgi:hypothetical protein